MWHKIWECQYDSKALTQLTMTLDHNDEDYDKWLEIIVYYLRRNDLELRRKEIEKTYGVVL